MEGIIAIIIIISAIVRMAENAKKVKQNAPGQSGTSASPAKPITQPTRPAVQPTRPVTPQSTIQPTVKPIQPNKGFWEQMMEAMEELEGETAPQQKKAAPEWGSLSKQEQAESVKNSSFDRKKAAPKAQNASLNAGHAAVGSLNEGSSRECEHGSLGGSMAYAHSDGTPTAQRGASIQSEPQEETVYRPAMTAEEMRQAVVMAEILKRPEERMAEQVRRWTLR